VKHSLLLRFLCVLCGSIALGCSSDEGSWRTPNGEIAVSRVAAPAPANVGSSDSATMAVYATIANTGTSPDTLVSVTAPSARTAELHETMDHGGTQMMMPAPPFVIPADGIARLQPGRTHVMLAGLTRTFAPGDTIPLVFTFRRAGPVNVNASVFAYEELQQALEP
jgi:copper(I)-binding protein